MTLFISTHDYKIIISLTFVTNIENLKGKKTEIESPFSTKFPLCTLCMQIGVKFFERRCLCDPRKVKLAAFFFYEDYTKRLRLLVLTTT